MNRLSESRLCHPQLNQPTCTRYYKEDPEIVAFFRHLIDQKSIHTVLDSACGPGQELMMLHALGCDITGSDVSPSMLQLARDNLADGSFDVPFHVADDEGALRAFRSIREAIRETGLPRRIR